MNGRTAIVWKIFEISSSVPGQSLMTLVLIHLHLHRLHPFLLQPMEPRVSIFSFKPWCFFFGRRPFALFCFSKELLSALFFFSKFCHESSPLFGPMAPCPAALAVTHLSSSRTVPWPLVWGLLVFAELCPTRPASPAWSFQEPSDLMSHL
jgi:hypothetical protein